MLLYFHIDIFVYIFFQKIKNNIDRKHEIKKESPKFSSSAKSILILVVRCITVQSLKTEKQRK